MSVEFMFGTILVLQLFVIYALYKLWDTRFSSKYTDQRIAWLKKECLTLWYLLRMPDTGSVVDQARQAEDAKAASAQQIATPGKNNATT